jgi:hypothetical protein
MTTTSVKHQNFIAEPMGEKAVTELAGIGPVYSAKLIEQGFDKVRSPKHTRSHSVTRVQAYVVLGQFLLLKKDKDMFIDWLSETAGANKHHATACHDCLHEWCEQHL